MHELAFEVEIEWSGSGRDGAGTFHAGDRMLDWSVPVSMGGRGEGASPEELLVSAVGTCYSATLMSVLRRKGLRADAVHVAASGTVAGHPAEARLERVTVSPTISGADPRRGFEYDRAAHVAHDRCLVGRAIAGNVLYEVGQVVVGTTRVRPAPVLAK